VSSTGAGHLTISSNAIRYVFQSSPDYFGKLTMTILR